MERLLSVKNGVKIMNDLVKRLADELGKTEMANVKYDKQINAVVVNEDAIQIFAHVIHINPNFYYFKLTDKAVIIILDIQNLLEEA